jgi:pyruvate dehydrogenase E1 component alpha subunit
METTTTKEELLGFFREMSLMRRLEIAADVAYKQKLIRGFLHLYNGQVHYFFQLRVHPAQEAVASGIESQLTPQDHVITAYRCHAHMVTRRCQSDVKSVLAELSGKKTGCSEGKGGSMHMYNMKTHFYGGNGIVGAQVRFSFRAS